MSGAPKKIVMIYGVTVGAACCNMGTDQPGALYSRLRGSQRILCYLKVNNRTGPDRTYRIGGKGEIG